MRVLTLGNMYPPHHLGGYEITWQSSVEHLRREGHSVRVLTTDFRRPRVSGDYPDVHRELLWYWRDHSFPHRGLRARVAIERHNIRVLDRHLAELRPHAICWWSMGGMSLGMIERIRRRSLPAVGVVGDDWMVYGPKVDAWVRLVRRPALSRLLPVVTGLPGAPDLSRSARWLFNSERTRSAALARGLDPDSAEVAHPGIDPQRFSPSPERPWDWRLVCVGRIDSRKGLALAIDVLGEVQAARLRVAGAGDAIHEAELWARARALGVTDRLEIREAARDEVAEVYAGSDALLFPVLWEEPWGLAPLEAMACGRLVVASGRGGSGEYLRDEVNCLVVDPDAGPRALVDALRRLAEDPALRRRLRKGGLETGDRYTERAYNERIEASLVRAVESHARVSHSR